MSHTDACVLCGNDVATEVRMALIEWREPIGKERWSHIPRCSDAAACRARVEDVLAEPWPIADGTPATVRRAAEPPPRVADPPADVEPVADAETPEADAEPLIPWLAT